MNNRRRTWLENVCDAAVEVTNNAGFAKIGRF